MSKQKNTTAEASAKKINTLADQPTEEWDIGGLTPHPKQAELIGSYSAQEIAELAEDIVANGLAHPLEVHPDGFLITGHRRKAALEQLGWSKAPVIIRHDLASQGDVAVESHLIRDNLMRSHYHPLKIARLYQRLKTLESSRNRGQKDSIGDLRDQLAKKFNKSGRTLDRYAAVLKTPPAIQQAVERDELSMSAAESISAVAAAQKGNPQEFWWNSSLRAPDDHRTGRRASDCASDPAVSGSSVRRPQLWLSAWPRSPARLSACRGARPLREPLGVDHGRHSKRLPERPARPASAGHSTADQQPRAGRSHLPAHRQR